MISFLFTNVYIFILAVVLAILEIQIEGPHGWAKNLPAWKPHTHHPLAKLYARFMNGKQLTGYHVAMFIFVFLIFHLPYAFGLEFTLVSWLETLSLFFMFIVLWDFLWFVLNPHYPLSNFKKGMIEWHAHWLWFAPVDYYSGLILSFLIILPLSFTSLGNDIFIWWATHLELFAIQTIIVSLFTLKVLDIDNWKVK